jgi:hypothetical protein
MYGSCLQVIDQLMRGRGPDDTETGAPHARADTFSFLIRKWKARVNSTKSSSTPPRDEADPRSRILRRLAWLAALP